MIKFLGLLSKKKKINSLETARLLVITLDEVIVNGFVEIQDFINNNQNLARNPNLSEKDIRWFRVIVFAGNLKMLSGFFDEDQAENLHNLLLDIMTEKIEGERDIALEQLGDYCTYMDDLLRKSDNCIEAMTTAVFDKYNINDFQVDLFKRKNEPNPVFFQELKNLMTHFIWNWEDFLSQHKVVV